jgi:hypothetical protein
MHRLPHAGPPKFVVLFDDGGTEEKIVFKNKRDFELWTATNNIAMQRADGYKEFIKRWEALQDGGRYHTSRTLEKTVSGAEVCAHAHWGMPCSCA